MRGRYSLTKFVNFLIIVLRVEIVTNFERFFQGISFFSCGLICLDDSNSLQMIQNCSYLCRLFLSFVRFQKRYPHCPFQNCLVNTYKFIYNNCSELYERSAKEKKDYCVRSPNHIDFWPQLITLMVSVIEEDIKYYTPVLSQ